MNLVNPAAGHVHGGRAGLGRGRLDAVQAPHVAARRQRRWQHVGLRAGVATTGTTGTIDLTFSGLTAGTKYLGSVVYDGSAGLPNPTIVRVDTP